jgi:hypothetical protein
MKIGKGSFWQKDIRLSSDKLGGLKEQIEDHITKSFNACHQDGVAHVVKMKYEKVVIEFNNELYFFLWWFHKRSKIFTLHRLYENEIELYDF